MEVKAQDILTLELDSKGRVLIPAEKRREYGVEDGDELEIAVLGSQ